MEMTTESIAAAVESVSGGYTLLCERLASLHPADWYLRYVLAYSERKEEYVTWVYNAEFNGLGDGHYFSNETAAFEDWKNR